MVTLRMVQECTRVLMLVQISEGIRGLAVSLQGVLICRCFDRAYSAGFYSEVTVLVQSFISPGWNED